MYAMYVYDLVLHSNGEVFLVMNLAFLLHVDLSLEKQVKIEKPSTTKYGQLLILLENY